MQIASNLPIVSVNIIVTYKGELPAIEIRKLTTKLDIIKILVSSAFHNRPVLIMPTFKDKLQSLNSLVDKGILYKDEKNDFYFTL